MSFLLTKLLPLFVYPLGLTIFLVLLAVFAMMQGSKRKAAFMSLLAISILWISSTGLLSMQLIDSLEKEFPPVSIKALPAADAIVILGGFTNATGTAVKQLEINDAVDRLFHGMRLYKAAKAPTLVLVGGAAEGNSPEANFMAEMLVEFGLPREDMLLENESRNTRENAVNSIEIMRKRGINKIILVTSAYHMRRAKAVYEKLGMDVVPAATDYQVPEIELSILHFLPDAGALGLTTLGIKEYLGWWVYRFRGWV